MAFAGASSCHKCVAGLAETSDSTSDSDDLENNALDDIDIPADNVGDDSDTLFGNGVKVKKPSSDFFKRSSNCQSSNVGSIPFQDFYFG